MKQCQKRKKLSRNVFLFMWTLCCLHEISLNCANYTPIDWTIVFLFTSIPYFIIWRVSKKSKHSVKNTIKIIPDTTQKEISKTHLSSIDDIDEISAILNHIRLLEDTLEYTLNEKEFEQALSDIKSRLKLLIPYEDTYIFDKDSPSERLKEIEKNEPTIRRKFHMRVYASQNPDQFH